MRTYSKERGSKHLAVSDTESVKWYKPVYKHGFALLFKFPPAVDAQLDDVGLSFVKNSISAIEKRGEL